ncbi:MAG TPA: response regulator transcription factor [bacterium]|nr:response regulator transcription factor [bacterium]
MKKPSPKRIMVIDDHPVVLRGLAAFLDEAEDLRVCAQAEDAASALAALNDAKPHLVLTDLFLNGVLAYDLIESIHREHPKVAILVLSVQKEAHYAERALRAGAGGYIIKEEASQTILAAVRAVLAGETFLSSTVRDRMIHRVESVGEDRLRSYVCKLSNRELEIFRLLGEGSFPRKIAADLGANLRTIETYYARIKKKLHLRSGVELTRAAIQWRSQL